MGVGSERGEEPPKMGSLGQETTGIAKIVELSRGQRSLGEGTPTRRPCNR